MKLVLNKRTGKTPRPLEERFFDFVFPEPNSGCWLWVGGLAGNGYGRFSIGNRKTVPAHRFSYELVHGPIPVSLNACHKCDVRCCVNPEHIFPGTQCENMADMVQKGRDNPRRGEENGQVRLTEAQIAAIRTDPRRLKIIGADYGIDKSRVWHIKRGHHWKHSQFAVPTEADRRKNGYAFQCKGEAHHKAKLTATDVLNIRKDMRPSAKIAVEYGVAKPTILRIKNGKGWRHI